MSYRLSKEVQAPIGDGFDIYMQNMDWVIEHAQTLKTLLSCKNQDTLKKSMPLVLELIRTSTNCLDELKQAIETL